MKNTLKMGVVALIIVLVACSDAAKHQHFCSRYSYYAKELQQPGNMPFDVIRQQLLDDIEKNDSDNDRLMLLALNDTQQGRLAGVEDIAGYCIEMRRWEAL